MHRPTMLISIHQERNSIWSRSVRFDLSVSRKRLSNPSKMLFFDTGRGQYFPIVGHLYSNFFFPVVGNVRDWRRPLSIPWSILTAPAILIAFFSVAAISSVKSSPDVHRWAHSSNVKCARPNNFESLKKLSSQSDGRALNHSITKSFSAEKEVSHFLVIRADTSETINFPPKIPPKKKKLGKNWKCLLLLLGRRNYSGHLARTSDLIESDG